MKRYFSLNDSVIDSCSKEGKLTDNDKEKKCRNGNHFKRV